MAQSAPAPEERAHNANGEELEETLISTRRPRQEAPQPPVETPPCLIVMSHPDATMLGRQYYLHGDEDLVIGRSADAGISLAGMQVVSRKHARIFRKGLQVMLEDLGSRNGTFLHGQRLLVPVKLNHGDQFSIETVHFRFIGGGNVEQAFHEAMYDLMTHDDLTGIFNRRKYEKDVERDFARAVRHRRPLALVLFDVDRFKEINDKFGHMCGDFVLRQVATLVSNQLRREGSFARFGGDEFAVLCPEVGLEGAKVLAERLRSAIAANPLEFEGTRLEITCSFGVAELSTETRKPADLYAAADARLYVAKSKGRNRVA